MAEIKDSGERRDFGGAVRDMSEGKGDMVAMPWESILRLSQHYEAGAKKYKRWNYRAGNGIPLSSYIDSACRHLAKYQHGERQQGILGCCETIRMAPTIIPAEKAEEGET